MDVNGNGRVFLVSAARTPIGKFGGAFVETPAVDLGGVAIRAALDRSGLPKDAPIDDVLMGQVLQAGVGQAPARQAALKAGLPVTTSATTINRVCGSGLKAIMLAAAEIRAGDAELVVAGGMESMNLAPYLLPKARFGYRLGDGAIVDSTVHDGLWCAIEGCHMGTHAERVAIADKVSRQDQDAFALASHQRAIAAIDEGRFDAEIAPVTVTDAKGRETEVRIDENPRRDSTLEALAKLRPAFDLPTGDDRGDATSGTVTAGNAPGITDGAAATIVASERAVERYGLKPLARIVGYAQAEVEPRWLFLPRSRESAGFSIGSSCRSRRSTSSRSTRRSRRRYLPMGGSSASTGRRSTSTAGQSRWVTRSGRAVLASLRRSSTSSIDAMAATDSRPSASVAAVRSRWHSSGSDRDRGRTIAARTAGGPRLRRPVCRFDRLPGHRLAPAAERDLDDARRDRRSCCRGGRRAWVRHRERGPGPSGG